MSAAKKYKKKKEFWRAVGVTLTQLMKRGYPSVKEGYMQLFLLIWDLYKEKDKEVKKQ